MNMNNITSLDTNNTLVRAQLNLYDILIPSFGGVVILLNFLVVISSGLILKKGQQPRSTYLFMGNVAMTDLMTGVAVVFGQLFPKENRNHTICAFQLGLIVASTLASVYSVGLIAIDRFLYILHGLKYQSWVYPTRARVLIGTTWIIGCIIGFLPVFGWYGDTNNGRICWFILLAPKNLILLTVIMGIIPLLVVVILYSIILYRVLEKIVEIRASKNRSNPDNNPNKLRFFTGRTQMKENSDNSIEDNKKGIFAKIFKTKPTNSVKNPTKWKAIKVVLFTSGSFVVTWSPYFIASIIYIYQCENNNSKRCKSLSLVIASPLAILGFVNSLINPIIYAWWHKGFRTYVQKRVSTVILKARLRNNSVNTTSQTSNNKSTNISNKQSVNKETENVKTIEENGIENIQITEK